MTAAFQPRVYDPFGELGDGLPDPGTDEGWAALADEAARWGYSDPQAYVAAYANGQINVGFAGYQPGNPHTGFGQVQAYDQAAATAGIPLDQYAAMHTPEKLAEARGEGGPPTDAGALDPSPFTPPANFTADGIPIEYGPDGTSIVPNLARQLPEGVGHYDRYTGEPLDAAGHVVPGVPNAGDDYEFTSALDQRIGLDEHGRVDPDEIDRLETAAREHGNATVADDVAATTAPFPGHPLSDTGAYARPVVLPGQPPIAYSGPDGSYVIDGDGTVITAGPGEPITYEGEHGSVVVQPSGQVITTDEHGHITVTEPALEYEDPNIRYDHDPDPDPDPIDGGNVLQIGELGPIHDDFPILVDTDGDGIVDTVVSKDTGLDDEHAATEHPSVPADSGLDDGFVTNEYHDVDGEFSPLLTNGPTGEDATPAAQDGGFGQGDPDTPDPRVTTTAEDLGAGHGSGAYDEDPLPGSQSGEDTGQDAGTEESGSGADDSTDDPADDSSNDPADDSSDAGADLAPA